MKRDWAKIIGEIRAKGMTLKALASHAGCDATKLYNILKGSPREPLHSEGDKILELHRKLCDG